MEQKRAANPTPSEGDRKASKYGDNVMNQMSLYVPKTISLAWLLVLASLGAVAFVALRYAPTGFFSVNGNSTPVAMEHTVPASAATTDDQLQSMHDALAALKEASSATARSQYWTDLALSSLDDSALTARRLQVARSASRSAEVQIDRAYSEIEITNGILTERKSK
jgi:hypothetical protein